MHEIADIACNFTSERFNKDLDEVISRAITNKITKFGLICGQLDDVEKLMNIYNQYSNDIFLQLVYILIMQKKLMMHI